LFAGLTVLENVMVAAAREAPTSLLQIILATAHQRQAEARIRETAMAALETVGLAHRANDAAKTLPYAQQRLLEIARALAAKPL
ncbi:ABC transporter ATP-binding protein, partial [Streptomyces scabiei]